MVTDHERLPAYTLRGNREASDRALRLDRAGGERKARAAVAHAPLGHWTESDLF